MHRLAFLPLLALLAVGCASSPLPDADDPVDNGLRAVWTAFQDGVRTDDADALSALLDPAGESLDDVPEMIIDITRDYAELKQDILETRAQDLRTEDDGLRVFERNYTFTDDMGNVEESGYYFHFRVADDGRAYLTRFFAAG